MKKSFQTTKSPVLVPLFQEERKESKKEEKEESREGRKDKEREEENSNTQHQRDLITRKEKHH